MSEVLTRAEMDVLKGHVIAHSKDRDAVYARAAELRPQHSAYLYFGEMPKHSWLSGWRYFGSGK